MKLKDLDAIMAGTRAIHRVELPLVNAPSRLQADQPELASQRAANMAAVQPGRAPSEAPSTLEVGVRVLTGEETAEVYQKAFEAAKKRGCTAPDEKDPVYALMLSVWTLAYACVDLDSDPKDPDLAFGEGKRDYEAAAERLLTSPRVGRDGIAFLAEAHELWQDLCHPQALKVSDTELGAVIAELVVDDPRPFLERRPGTRWSLMRFMALRLQALLEDRSTPGSPGTIDTSASTTSPRSGEP